jgi:hypothetical protein
VPARWAATQPLRKRLYQGGGEAGHAAVRQNAKE